MGTSQKNNKHRHPNYHRHDIFQIGDKLVNNHLGWNFEKDSLKKDDIFTFPIMKYLSEVFCNKK